MVRQNPHTPTIQINTLEVMRMLVIGTTQSKMLGSIGKMNNRFICQHIQHTQVGYFLPRKLPANGSLSPGIVM